MIRMSSSLLEQHLLVMRPGKPAHFFGTPVERMGQQYRVNREPTLYPLQLAVALLMRKVEQQQRPVESTIKIPTKPLFPREQRAISLHFPWAWLAANGFKGEEYRTVATRQRGMTFLHASGSTESDDVIEQYRIPKAAVVRQRIIGAATIVDCEQRGERDFAYILEDEIYFDRPTSALPGQQSIFWDAVSVERHIPARVRAFNEAWLMLEGKL